MREILSVLPGSVIGSTLIRAGTSPASMGPHPAGMAARQGNGTMDIAHAFAAGQLSARATDRRFRTDEAEVRAAERRVAERRAALVESRGRSREYTERGRHAAAPRPISA